MLEARARKALNGGDTAAAVRLAGWRGERVWTDVRASPENPSTAFGKLLWHPKAPWTELVSEDLYAWGKKTCGKRGKRT